MRHVYIAYSCAQFLFHSVILSLVGKSKAARSTETGKGMMATKTAINLELIHELRNENGYSISDLADELGYKTPTGYWLLEKGQRKISVDVLYQLAHIYGLTMEELLVVTD